MPKSETNNKTVTIHPCLQSLRFHIDKDFDVLILLLDQCPDTFLDQVVHVDLRRDHLLWFQSAIRERLYDGFKVCPLVAQHRLVFTLSEDQHIWVEGYCFLPDSYILSTSVSM